MMSAARFLVPKPPQNPSSPSESRWSGLRKLRLPASRLPKTVNPIFKPHSHPSSHLKSFPFPLPQRRPSPLLNPNAPSSSPTAVSAGRSKKKTTGGRIEGSGEIRRIAKANARRLSRRISQNRFYRRSRAAAQNADRFTDEELEMIGLGYDRAVQFMSKDDPRLRHPYDWYKYGKYGPYSWRGIVVGPPIRGRFTDERVTIIGEVRDHEEFEQIEQFEMANDFSSRLKDLNPSVGRRHYWVFVRHPKWKPTELPWEQWTLVSEVVLEAGKKERIDKWNLMGRLGNRTRRNITQCAAWMRPDIIYVKRPLYQCRFEPQDVFFEQLVPLLDPKSENLFKFELRREENGRVLVENCTYFGGLCRIVKVSPKSYVDDVVNAYQKLSDEGKSRCLDFLLRNHPLELLHPYTKEWKAKLEEMELGCDAPDESDEEDDRSETEVTEWMEEDGDGEEEEEEEEEEEDYVIEAGEGGEDEVIDVGEDDEGGEEEEVTDPEETEEYWDDKWEKALRSSEAMEELLKKRFEASSRLYKEQKREEGRERASQLDADEADVERERIKAEWKQEEFKWRRRNVKKGRIPPELFLKGAVRPFTYRNLVKEIVLMRHAIVDGDIILKT